MIVSILSEISSGNTITGTNAGPPPEGGSRAVSDGAGGGGGGGSMLGKVGGLVLKKVLSEWDKSYNNANAGNAEGAAATPASGSRGVSFALPMKPIKNVGLTGWRKFAAEWERSQG